MQILVNHLAFVKQAWVQSTDIRTHVD